MIAPSTHSPDSAWSDCYKAALFQDDTTQLPPLITRAESEINARARLLFETPGDNVREIRALDNALHMLKMLRSCAKIPPA